MEMRGIAAIVTGAASGLGAATAALLAEKGAKVALFDLNQEAGEAQARKIGGRYFSVDVTSEPSVTAGVEAAQAEQGVARILVNCAGIAPAARIVSRDGIPFPMEVFRRAIEINLIGSFLVLSKFAAALGLVEKLGEERGVIINTASVAAFDGQIGQAAYSASKAGIAGLTLPVARDLAGLGIRVMTIAPGIFLTPMLESLPQETQDSLAKQVPFPSRLGQPEEYAALVAHIIANSMLNGETIRLDGAIRMGPR